MVRLAWAFHGKPHVCLAFYPKHWRNISLTYYDSTNMVTNSIVWYVCEHTPTPACSNGIHVYICLIHHMGFQTWSRSFIVNFLAMAGGLVPQTMECDRKRAAGSQAWCDKPVETLTGSVAPAPSSSSH